jgi:hypothetical protein
MVDITRLFTSLSQSIFKDYGETPTHLRWINRQQHIKTLKEASNGNIEPLIEFARS